MKKALVLFGGWPWHYPKEMAHVAVEKLLDGFDVELSEDLTILESNRLHEFDVIIPIWTQGELSQFQEISLVEAIENGLGLASWHGLLAAFDHSHPFKMVLGGQFIAHPGNFIDYRVDFSNIDPLTKGLSSFNIFSEQYYMHVDPNNEVIASTIIDGDKFTWLKGGTMPVAWKRQWGKGRVFYHTLGHKPEELEIPEVLELTKRGIKWAAKEI
ncbi:ThuA domain-containing protein [Bacillus sp. 28A-2]|uniref:ThuA domain-containing protein n=1 Tax=Bacillus sp. 28A-2 TaxID=2772252 RepID=UPI00168D3950|nr:ThuA domain-containing protein [Bacillus sp. 28A-2]MBD3861612.1 ThuA domain-containing protein [Bacillus sp. 28A-2]